MDSYTNFAWLTSECFVVARNCFLCHFSLLEINLESQNISWLITQYFLMDHKIFVIDHNIYWTKLSLLGREFTVTARGWSWNQPKGFKDSAFTIVKTVDLLGLHPPYATFSGNSTVLKILFFQRVNLEDQFEGCSDLQITDLLGFAVSLRKLGLSEKWSSKSF